MNICVVLVIACSLCHIASSCSLPSYTTGTWENPSKGNVTFNGTHMTGYDVYTYTGLTFECHLQSGAYYVLRSDDFTVLGGNTVNAAICVKFKKLSSKKLTYFVLTSQLADADNERVIFLSSSATGVTKSDICDDPDVSKTPQETKLLIKYGSYAQETVMCPKVILGTYYYINVSGCWDSYWDVCESRDTMTFNYTMCSDLQAFSDNGTVYCMYQTSTKSNGESMVYVYNGDNTVDDSTTYRFTCMVIGKSSGLVYVTQYPGDCYSNQSSTYVPSDGTSIILSANVTCVPSNEEESVASAGLIAGLVILFLILIVAGAVGGYYLYMKKFKKIDPDDKRILDKEDSRMDPVTPSVVNAEMQETKTPINGGSHGKLKQVLGPEYTMTNASDETKATGELEEIEDIESPRKLPPIMTGNTPRDQLSPLDTQLKKPALPAIP